MPTKTAVVRQAINNTLIAKSDSGHWTVMDTSIKGGGLEGAASPKELLLFALGGCTSMDVIGILQKKRAPMRDYEVRLTATVREEHPQVYTDIHLTYVIYGKDVRKEDVERAIELSEKQYCSVSAMLRPVIKITHEYVIEE
jgi:putative redox protein